MKSKSVKVMRETPSSKARSRSHAALRKLFHLLWMLEVPYGYYGVYCRFDLYDIEEPEGIDFKGWRDWIIRHTPADKRGGPSPLR